jgi:hypothetical protein
MKEYQKTMNAFLEGVCQQFNCMNALPALKKGFNALCEASDNGIMEGTGAGFSLFPLDSTPFQEDRLFKKTMQYSQHPDIMRQKYDWIFKNGKWDDEADAAINKSKTNLTNHLNRLLSIRNGNDDVHVDYDDYHHLCSVWYKNNCIGFVFPNHGKGNELVDLRSYDFQEHFSGLQYASLMDFLDGMPPDQKEILAEECGKTNIQPDDLIDIFYHLDGEEDNDAGTGDELDVDQCVWRIIRDVHRFKTEIPKKVR